MARPWPTVAFGAALLASMLASGAAALAQPTPGPAPDPAAAYAVASSAVGHWLYDQQGNIVGSIRSLTDDGRTAVIMVGSYFQPGSHLTAVPASALFIVNGKVTVRNETIQALNTVFWWR